MENKLSARGVAAEKKPGLYADGGNLYLQIGPTGTKSWSFRYKRNGRARQMGLGPWPLLSLADARERARAARKQLLDGFDPIDVRQEAKQQADLAASRSITFKEAAEQYIELSAPGWKNAKHPAQWRATLKTYAYPVIGELPVSRIDTNLVLQIIQPIWTNKTETASRVRNRIELILNWAAAMNFREGENPARWKGLLDRVLPSKTAVSPVKHRPALHYDKLPAFWLALSERPGIAPLCLKFTILTCVRTCEAIEATWDEFDLEKQIWTVPGDQMKGRKGNTPEHRVPLSGAAIEVLNALPRDPSHDWVFAGWKRGSHLGDAAMLKVLKEMGHTDFVVHGFRSTFRDWGTDCTTQPEHLLEAALAHKEKNGVIRAYRRTDMFEKRRKLMEAWARFATGGTRLSAKVVPIRRVDA